MTNLYNKMLVEYKKKLRLSKLQRHVIVGALLGKAEIKQESKRVLYTVKFEQKVINKQYIYELCKIFEEWVGSHPKVKEKKKGRYFLWFKIHSHTSLNVYHKYFYSDNKKKVPNNIVKLMDRIVLSFWFMEDGKKIESGYKICSYQFNYAGHENLVKALNKLGLNPIICKTVKNKYYLKINENEIKKFTDIVKPFTFKCMLFKLHKEKKKINMICDD